jgi:endoglucanase
MEALLRKLVDAPSISGSEESVREVMTKELKPHVDDIKVDRVGNLITRKGSGSPKIMLAAHMDEIGLMVKYITKDGFIKFDTVGGWDDRIMLGSKVKVHGSKGPLVGVIGTKPIHLQDREESRNIVKKKDMFIDTGAADNKEMEKYGISAGDFITHYGQVDRMLGTRLTGYGLDNRIGCLVMIEAVKALKNFKGSIYAVGTVQEEIGLIGVRGSAFGINPDAMLALDVCIAGDTPSVGPEETNVALGKGPCLVLKDASSIVNPRVRKWVTETAKKNKIKLQYEVTSGGATDAAVMPVIREGIASGALSTPLRHIHTPVEVADMKDIHSTIALVVKLVESAGAYF